MTHGFWFSYDVEKSRRADMQGAGQGGRRHDDHPQAQNGTGLTWSDALKARPAEKSARKGMRRRALFGRLWR